MPGRYLDIPAVRDRAAAHVAKARREAREARTARRYGYPDVAAIHEDRAAYRMSVARWLAAGAPARRDGGAK